MRSRSLVVDVVPAQIASVGDPQAMAVDGQSHQPNLGDRAGWDATTLVVMDRAELLA